MGKAPLIKAETFGTAHPVENGIPSSIIIVAGIHPWNQHEIVVILVHSGIMPPRPG